MDEFLKWVLKNGTDETKEDILKYFKENRRSYVEFLIHRKLFKFEELMLERGNYGKGTKH